MCYKKIILSILSFLFLLSLSSCFLGISLDNLNDFSKNEKKRMEEYYGIVLPYCTGYSYKINDTYSEDFQFEYKVSNIKEKDYQDYVNQFKEYKLIGERIDEKTSMEYKTFFDTNTNTYIDLCYYTGELFYKPYLDVYMYQRGYVNYYDTYYTNEDNPISLLGDTINMNNSKYPNLSYINGYDYFCPSKGDVKILVLPIDFNDKPYNRNTISIDEIKTVLYGTNNISVRNYYLESSYEKLNLSFEVVNSWYRAKKNSSYYDSSLTISELVNDALAYYDNQYDYSKFDSNSDGAIDGIILVHTLDSSSKLDIAWPATRNNVKEYGNQKDTYDNVFAYRFYHINYDQIITRSHTIDSYTLIHEFGHMMGLDDYYDTNYTDRTFLPPLNGMDVMDGEFTDQNVYSKLLLGWINEGKVINKSKTIELNSFEHTGDFAIISNNFDLNYGPFQEFYIIVYNSGLGLNNSSTSLNQSGIIIYHVDGCLYTYNSGTVMMNYNNDQAGEYSERFNLIEFAKKDYNPYVLTSDGQTTLNLVDNNKLDLSFTLEMQTINSTKIYLSITIN